jgi:RNA polymerase sigma-70 factor (ECF subfamily)
LSKTADIERFTSVVYPLRDKLYRYALKLLGDDVEAEDNVQETFLRLWSMRDKSEKYSNLGGLAMRINKNLCLDKLRKHKNVTTTVDCLYNYACNETADTALNNKQMIEIIEKIIATLPSLQQIIISMRDIEGYEIDEIAALTSTRPETVRVNLSRARQYVREQYVKSVR